VPDDIRRKLLDEVVDELLAGAKTEEEIVAFLCSQSHPGTCRGFGFTAWA
jgi:hypothetical protein